MNGCVAACLLTTAATLIAPHGVFAVTNLTFTAGADERIRQEFVINKPRGGVTGRGVADDNSWIRFRTRAWGQVDSKYLGLYLRLGNEFRSYPTRGAPGGDTRNWRFPDELYVDNLYLDAKDLFDERLSLRVGRQDFRGPEAYGGCRVIGDGTPGDDARTDYFDAVRARIAFTETEKLDVLGTWNSAEYTLCWGDSYCQNRKPNSILPGTSGLTECGGGLYHRSRTVPCLPTDFYWIYKHESDAEYADGRVAQGRGFCTFGLILSPKFGEHLGGEFEVAGQAGKKDNGANVGGWMSYSALEWDFLPGETVAPWLRGSCYAMSGDSHRSEEGDDFAWNPVWGRWPQFSDLWVKTFFYGIAYWSNLVYPALEAGVSWKGHVSFKGATGPLCAAVDDGVAYGNGGNYIGWLSSAQVEIPLFDKIWNGRCSATTQFRCEMLNLSGDYTESRDTAAYLRWVVTLSF